MLKSVVLIALLVLGIVVVISAIWVRIAPLRIETFHVDPAAGKSGLNSYQTTVERSGNTSEVFDQVVKIALSSPRTTALKIDQELFIATFVSRSLIWGFPDITSIKVQGEGGAVAVTYFGRAKFGVGDMGVNRARIKSWIKRLDV